MTRLLSSLFVAIFFGIGAANAAEAPKLPKAKEAPKPAAQQGACQKDAEKHCSGFGMHDGLTQCLSDHKAELSDVCAAQLLPVKK